MLDVHPAHHAADTWRDFSIHIATIVVGLLIAVALEQTVEAVRHSIERHELIEDFHRECESNNRMINANLAIFNLELDRHNGMAGVIRQAQPVNGTVTVVVPPRPYMADWQFPSHTVWTVAKSNGKAALLPDGLAQVYDRVDLQAVEYMRALQLSSDADTRLRSVKQRLGIRLAAGETLHLSAADAEDLANALSDSSAGDQLPRKLGAELGGRRRGRSGRRSAARPDGQTPCRSKSAPPFQLVQPIKKAEIAQHARPPPTAPSRPHVERLLHPCRHYLRRSADCRWPGADHGVTFTIGTRHVRWPKR